MYLNNEALKIINESFYPYLKSALLGGLMVAGGNEIINAFENPDYASQANSLADAMISPYGALGAGTGALAYYIGKKSEELDKRISN